MANRRSLKQLLDDPDIRQLPVKVELDCSQERLYSLSNSDDIVCINETQLWSDMVRRGVDLSTLSDRQRKAALVRAVLAHLERNEDGIETGLDGGRETGLKNRRKFDKEHSLESLGNGRIGDRQHEQIVQNQGEVEFVNVPEEPEIRQQDDEEEFQSDFNDYDGVWDRGRGDIPDSRIRDENFHERMNPMSREVDEVREAFLPSQIEKPLPQVDPVRGNGYRGNEVDDVMHNKRQQGRDETSYETQIQEPVVRQAKPVEPVLQNKPVVRENGERDPAVEKQVRGAQPQYRGDEQLEKQVDQLLVELFQQPPTASSSRRSATEHARVLHDNKFGALSSDRSVPNLRNGQPKLATEHALQSKFDDLVDHPVPHLNNGHSQVPSEHAQRMIKDIRPKPPMLVQSQSLNHPLSQDDFSRSDKYGNHDNHGNYGDNNDQLERQPSMPNWIPQESVLHKENLPYSIQRAPEDNSVKDPDSPENQNKLMEDDPLSSILAPVGHNPRYGPRKGDTLVAKKKKIVQKMPTDYFFGLNLAEDKPPQLPFDNLNSTTKDNSTTLVAVSSASNVSKSNQNGSNELQKLRKVNGGVIQMNEQLFQMVGYDLPVNFDLRARRLPTKFDPQDPKIVDRLKYLNEAVANTDPVLRGVTSTSLHPDLLRRAKFQQHQMKLYCSQNHLDSTLPSNPDDLDTLFQHLLYDDSKRLIFCYVPKNGCSNMKRMMLVLNGILAPESVGEKRPPESVLKQVHSFRNLTLKEALYKLRHYYKAIIVRNPMERLLSGYRNKLEPPLNFTLRKHFPDRLKAYILRKYDSKILQAWIDYGNYSIDLHPSFSNFLQFMVKFPLRFYNEHFRPALELCYPCAMQYDFYMNFKSMEYDVYALMHLLGIPFDYYPSNLSHPLQRTSDFMESYFGGVALTEKVKLFEAFAQELEFYYSLYPEEWGMHKEL